MNDKDNLLATPVGGTTEEDSEPPPDNRRFGCGLHGRLRGMVYGWAQDALRAASGEAPGMQACMVGRAVPFCRIRGLSFGANNH